MSEKRVLDAEDMSLMFGLHSKIYSYAIKYLKEKAKKKPEVLAEKLKRWNAVYKNIYGSVDDELFYKHTYFALLLKILLRSKLGIMGNLDYEEIYEDLEDNDLSPLNLTEFTYFYSELLNRKLFKQIFEVIENAKFAQEDLFYDLYQEIFFGTTRHRLGEFYTIPTLVKAMIKDTYKPRDKVLDPSCGSGSFLTQIVITILESDLSPPNKLKAINNVYGFDINPLAILTAQVNILLLMIEYFKYERDVYENKPKLYVIDSLFPQDTNFEIAQHYGTFDLIIGNPPWLTYKDITCPSYQDKLRGLTESLNIKPGSQHTTHIELAAIFFYALPSQFLKKNGIIFFVMTKSVLNGDHCFKFRAFRGFDQLELWDFPNNYIFNIEHICLKARYIGEDDGQKITEKYPIPTKIYNDELELKKETIYSSIKFEEDGAKTILPKKHLDVLQKVSYSPYKSMFYQGATLVPRTLVFFEIIERKDPFITISSDQDVYSRSKKNWKFQFEDKIIEKKFRYKTFLNKDLIPFFLKKKRRVFLPITEDFEFDEDYIAEFPHADAFYREMDDIYRERKKSTSKIKSLFDNLNYWNKLTKQRKNKSYLVVYNASGSNLKAAVLPNFKKNLIIGSENYYYSTDSKREAYYLCGVLNSPIFSKNIKLIKSSRHIHKRPFSFNIPLYQEENELHESIAKKAIKLETIAQDLFMNNPGINSEKVRIFMTQKLEKLDVLVEMTVFK